MKIKFMTIVLILFCLAVFTQLVILCSGSQGVQNVGGDFGRSWLNNYQAQNPAASGNNTTSNNSTSDWGGKPKGAPGVNSTLVQPQNTSSTNTDWLGSSTITGSQTSSTGTPQNGATQQQTYFATGTSKPVHKIDESFNHSSVMPEPDASGNINGIPAETYYAFGPAIVGF